MADVDTTVETTTDQPNWLEMSDEELMKQPVPGAVVAPVVEEAVVVEETTKPEPKEEVVEETPPNPDGNDDKDDGDDAPAGADKAQGRSVKAPAADAKETKDKTQPPEPKPEAAKADVDYAEVGKQLLAPFKANGREIQVNSLEDARSLMQMGANYNKKMAALKPNLKVLKLLENNDLLDEGKLSFLIDLDKKDPAAINKLIKDSGINPIELDADKANDYRPKNRQIDDREVDLDNVLEDLKESPAYARTLQVVGVDWDKPSKRLIGENPQLLRIIHGHIESGIFDQIAAEVERERMFGRLDGMSDLEAYRQVGDAINARQGFTPRGSSSRKAPGDKVDVTPEPKKDDGGSRDDKRRALAPTRAAAPSAGAKVDFNPLALSDAEISKLSASHFR